MNKRISIGFHYIGLMSGILIINFVLQNHKEYADYIMDGFQKMAQIDSVNGQDLFLYLFIKRGKQVLLFCLFYIQISKIAALLFLDYYFAFLEGAFLSLCTFYYSVFQAMLMIVMLLPQFIGYAIFKKFGWNNVEKKRNQDSICFSNVIYLAIVVTIVMTITEIIVNLRLGQRIFAYK